MNHEPDFKELIRALNDLIQAQIDREGGNIMRSFVQQKQVRLYNELDSLAASMAIAHLPSLDESAPTGMPNIKW